ncbi:MFS transporter [Cellulomonas alba]|uniref:MFS transporter n=1 Tax=Cellulomonas alba TaxID=3053467 RepID=A0ABT7SJ57_9CELL|nr:MFS transporter [Cellulomonas alba]MDM7856222.1 MFS transporter [Cellulomonas alba]
MSTPYSAVLRLPGVARLYGVGFVARIPAAMVGVVLTLHVVSTLGHGYGQAGVVSGALTVGMAIGSPWRGRLVDRFGLRRAIAPSVLVESAVWLAAPHLAYWPLVGAAFVAGLFLVPVFSVTRQSLSVLVPLARQREAFALDSVFVELTFMLSPVVGVLLATQVSTTVALTVVGSLTVAAGALLMWANPPTRSATAEGDAPVVPADGARERLLGPALVVVLLAAVAASFVLIGTDVSLVAALNGHGRAADVGWMVAIWAGGSVVGGLIHGASRRTPSPLLLVALLGLATAPAALVSGPVGLAIAVFVAGLPCAPALASINAALVRIVPEHRRGEVMGWSGTMSTVGNALGAPICGIAIDRVSPGAGFLTAAAVGGGIAAAGLLALRFVGGAPAGDAQVEERAVEAVATGDGPVSQAAPAGAPEGGALSPEVPAPRPYPALELDARPRDADVAEPAAASHAVGRAGRATRVRRAAVRTRARAAVRRPSR